MNKTRIFGGFSLVEMMLLLLIVSLMIASSVAVISKRHVKVPRLAMHGAFMCYYKDNNGTKQLWEERYVGSGLNKKIVDQAASGGDHCLFTPPDKVSYLHIQATGGGGGGGDSGYRGGDPQPHKSETEVLSPFGLTEEYLLEVKGTDSMLHRADSVHRWMHIHLQGLPSHDLSLPCSPSLSLSEMFHSVVSQWYRDESDHLPMESESIPSLWP